jgi:hypothetical protein
MAIEFKEYSEEEIHDINDKLITACEKCVYYGLDDCYPYLCCPHEREDKKNGYYIEVPD